MDFPYVKLIDLLSGMVQVDDFDRDIIIRNFEPVAYARKTVLVPVNGIARFMYFINTGYLRTYYNTRDDQEVTNNINCPMGFITAFGSYVSQRPSFESLECITDCELLRISREKLENLFRHSQKWSEVGRRINEHVVRYNEERTRQMVSLSAEERYQRIMDEHPDFIQHIPLQYIASFIGVKPESLSRIRKNLSNQP